MNPSRSKYYRMRQRHTALNLKHPAALCCTAVLAAVLCAGTAAASAHRALTDSEINALVATCADTGFERAFLQAIFRDQRVRYVPKLVRLLVIPPDFSANYTRFTAPAEIKRARSFARLWRTRLGRAGDTYGVDPDIIVAILLVETGFGSTLGRSPVLSVFASLILENTLHRQAFSEKLAGNPLKDHYLQRLAAKAAWAREELDALLAIQRRGIDIHGLKGSYAGAFGIPQFLPSSYIKWASSGEDKRNPDLFYVPHAIVSVANFLKEHGWRPGLTDEEQREVIWHYNRSSAYVDTVLAVAGELNKNPSQ